MSGKWLNMLGLPGVGFDMLVHGTEGSGKTTLLLQMAKYFANELGKEVLYISAEEFGRATLTQKLDDMGINSTSTPRLTIAGDLKNCVLHEFDIVLMDSISHSKIALTLEQYQRMKEQNPSTSFILIVQSIKSGDFRGSREWAHEVDMKLGVDMGKVTVEKNRYYNSKYPEYGKKLSVHSVFDN